MLDDYQVCNNTSLLFVISFFMGVINPECRGYPCYHSLIIKKQNKKNWIFFL